MIAARVSPVRIVVAVTAPLLLVAALAAQDPGAGEEVSVMAEIFDYDNAGFIGYVIVLISVVALALIIENFMTIKREKLAPPNVVDELEALFDGESFQQAVELCERDKTYLTNVVGAGLGKLGHPFETVQTAVREMQAEESVKLFQKVGWLSLIAAMSTMLGLFGTVTGMFVTFSAIARAGTGVSPAHLAGGIKMALITTIFGLSVAMPVSVAAYALRNRVIRTSTEINAISDDLFERFRRKP